MALLKNYEFYAKTSNPIVGATVTLHAASVAHPNTNAALQTTTTDANGMWIFSAAAGVYDVKVSMPGIGYTKWYKGMTGHNLDYLTLGGWEEFVDQGSDPAAPGAGSTLLYTKGGKVYVRAGASGAATELLALGSSAANQVFRSSAAGVGSWGQILTAMIAADAITAKLVTAIPMQSVNPTGGGAAVALTNSASFNYTGGGDFYAMVVLIGASCNATTFVNYQLQRATVNHANVTFDDVTNGVRSSYCYVAKLSPATGAATWQVYVGTSVTCTVSVAGGHFILWEVFK